MEKSLEVDLGEFRDAISKAKKENKSLNLSLKTSEAELDSTNEDNLNTEEIKDDLKDQLKLKNDVLKATNIEVTDLEKYRIGLEKQLEMCMREQESTRQDNIREKEKKEFQCSHCGVKLKSTVHLSQQVIQTSIDRKIEFKEYHCHYCTKRILSEEDLENHKPVC